MATTPTRSRLELMRARCQALHGDDGGQSIVYLVIMIFLLASFTFMVINSGALIHDKMQTQSAADAAVMSGTTWVVRAMNLNSMMNIFMAMLMAEEVLMKAAYWTSVTAMMMAPAIEAFWLGVCFTTGNCTPRVEVTFDTFDLFPLVHETTQHEQFIDNVMQTLSNVEQGVHTTMVGVASLEAWRLATDNGADFGMMYPRAIPEEQGQLEDLCETTADGAAGGYKESEYPLTPDFMGVSGTGLAGALATISGFEYDDKMRNEALGIAAGNIGRDGPLWGDLQIPYHRFWANTAPYHFTNVMFTMAVTARYGVLCGEGLGPGSVNFDIPAEWWCFFCPNNNIEIPNPYYYLGSMFGNLDSSNPNVRPYVLTEDWDPNYWGFAWKNPEDIQAKFIPDHFQNPFGDTLGMMTFAQAQIYNPHEEGGLFSPHWRSHLTPVDVDDSTIEDVSAFLLSPPAELGSSSSGLFGLVTEITGVPLNEIIAH
ncbi:MAG TPA: hypothetical protein DIU15_00255 [Deltaproteobacteria bacterium]|nr:hypothetical protein [Deltaproteobacteria bacterium]HCP44459.1 hypothetical protein [Deltaproteobacteria bacterium]